MKRATQEKPFFKSSKDKEKKAKASLMEDIAIAEAEANIKKAHVTINNLLRQMDSVKENVSFFFFCCLSLLSFPGLSRTHL
jgi:hypothetical protein